MSENVISEGEISDTNLPNIEEMVIDTPLLGDKDDDPEHEISLEKIEQRAQRFQTQLTNVKSLSDAELRSLYKSLDVDLKAVSEMRAGKVRLDAVHVRGVSNMATEDIFEYFKDYAPASVEWVNDQTCNVLWLDVLNPARALLTLSQPIKKRESTFEQTNQYNTVVEAETTTTEDIEMLEQDSHSATTKSRHRSSSSVDSDTHQSSSVIRTTATDQSNTPVPNNSPVDVEHIEEGSLSESIVATEVDPSSIEIPIPPGSWRLGLPHPKARFLLLRFAYKSDRKVHGAEKRSQYYLKHGNPNYKGLKGIISNSLKRKLRESRYAPSGYVDLDAVDDDNHFQSTQLSFAVSEIKKKDQQKRPRMRMYADDEEEKAKRPTLTISSGQRLGVDLRNKIGIDKSSLHGDLEDGESPDLRSRLTSKSPASKQWSLNEKSQDLSRPSVIGDLRSKLEKLRQARQPRVPLLIEIVPDG